MRAYCVELYLGDNEKAYYLVQFFIYFRIAQYRDRRPQREDVTLSSYWFHE